MADLEDEDKDKDEVLTVAARGTRRGTVARQANIPPKTPPTLVLPSAKTSNRARRKRRKTSLSDFVDDEDAEAQPEEMNLLTNNQPKLLHLADRVADTLNFVVGRPLGKGRVRLAMSQL